MISVQQLGITQGVFSLRDISFEVPRGRYGILMGPTGCGKTTVLEAICGLRKVHLGSVMIGGEDMTHWKAANRGVGYVPQDGALFRTMTVRRQMSLPLTIRKWPRHQIDQRISELAELLGISHLLERKPQNLSGGEAQRVALGRALSFRPNVLCLDEPLSALDDETRQRMYGLLKSVQQHEDVTVLHITHSREEADTLGDVVFHMRDGIVAEHTRSA